MKINSIIAILIFICQLAFSQGYSAVGDLIYPLSEEAKSIFLLTNKIDIIKTQLDGKFTITTEYLVENSDNIEKQCIFAYENTIYREYAQPLSPDNFLLLVNGEKASYDLEKLDKKQIELIKYTCKLKPGLNTITHSHNDRSQNIEGTSGVYFTTTNGKFWNQNKLNSLLINIHCVNDYITVSGIKNLNIIGSGKSKIYLIGPKDDIYFLKDGYIQKEFSSYDVNSFSLYFHHYYFGVRGGAGQPIMTKKPTTADQYILAYRSAITICNYVLGYLSNGHNFWDDGFLKEMMNSFEGYSKEELRLLRNSIFAYKGYQFKDSYLRDFFNNALCYLPNKDITEESIIFDRDDEFLLTIIKWLEMSKSREKIINDINRFYFNKYEQFNSYIF